MHFFMFAIGCYRMTIENGLLNPSTCSASEFQRIAYCHYSCNDGYVQTAFRVYCPGNSTWIPSGQDDQACRKSTDLPNACYDIFPKNGYKVTCPEPFGENKTDCMYTCNKGYKPASSSVNCIRNEWFTSDTYSEPCIPDDSIVKSSTTTRRPTVMTTMSPSTTYSGYYDYPNLKMDVSPLVFVAAVIGGLLAIGLLISAIYCRVLKKKRREARARSIFVVASDPLSAQNNYTTNNADTLDSRYREVARRIVAQSQSQSTYCPPPYDPNYSYTNPAVQNTYNGSSAPSYPAIQSPADENHEMLSNHPSPPYTTTYNSGHGNQGPLFYTANDQRGIFQLDNTRDYDYTSAHEINAQSDNPPPYEEVQNCTKNCTDEQTFDEINDPPPPYTIDGDNP